MNHLLLHALIGVGLACAFAAFGWLVYVGFQRDNQPVIWAGLAIEAVIVGLSLWLFSGRRQ